MMDYEDYLESVYKLDYHMNKVHRKLRITRFRDETILEVGKIIILNELVDCIHNLPLDIIIEWHYSLFYWVSPRSPFPSLSVCVGCSGSLGSLGPMAATPDAFGVVRFGTGKSQRRKLHQVTQS